MKYQVEVIINEEINKVTSLYVDLDQMPLWEKGLVRIVHNEGMLFQTHSKGQLIFSFGGVEMPMKVTVEKENLPDQIIQIFEVPGAWNRCDSHFLSDHNQTKWQMDVEFRFENPVDLPIERFIEKTTESMNIFKKYVEGKKK